MKRYHDCFLRVLSRPSSLPFFNFLGASWCWGGCQNKVCAHQMVVNILLECSTATENYGDSEHVKIREMIWYILEASSTQGLCPYLQIREQPASLGSAQCLQMSLRACPKLKNPLYFFHLPDFQASTSHDSHVHQKMPVLWMPYSQSLG